MTVALTKDQCECRYPVPQTSPPREEGEVMTYQCGLPLGHTGQHGPLGSNLPDFPNEHRTSNPMTDRELYLLTECTEWRSCGHLRCKARREIERLGKLAYIGEHHFPDLTYKARLEEIVAARSADETSVPDLVTRCNHGRTVHATWICPQCADEHEQDSNAQKAFDDRCKHGNAHGHCQHCLDAL